MADRVIVTRPGHPPDDAQPAGHVPTAPWTTGPQAPVVPPPRRPVDTPTGSRPPPPQSGHEPLLEPPRDPAFQPPPVGSPRQRYRRTRRVLRRVLVGIVVLQVVLALFLAALRWWTPPRTAFMLEDGGPITYQFVSLNHVSRYLLAAVIAHEDEQLGQRSGPFTAAEFVGRAKAYLTGADDPTGSTIPQQLAKNVFLWPSQDPVRKGLEAGLAAELTVALSDQRLLELYVNYAQFGPHLYGVCAASWFYFDEPPWDMTEYQSAQLMGVLPLPDRVRRAPEGGIDLGPGVDPTAVDLVNGAANVHVPLELAGMGGWEAAVATVGITDTAAAHAHDRGDEDACSTMPASVADRLPGR